MLYSKTYYNSRLPVLPCRGHEQPRIGDYVQSFVKEHEYCCVQVDDGDGRSHRRRDADSHRDGGDGKERKHRSRDELDAKESSHRDRDRERKEKHRSRDEV